MRICLCKFSYEHLSKMSHGLWSGLNDEVTRRYIHNGSQENKLVNGKWHWEGRLCLISSSPKFQIAKAMNSFIRFHVLAFILLNIPRFHSSVLILFSLHVVNKVQLGMFCLTTCFVWFCNYLLIYILVEM